MKPFCSLEELSSFLKPKTIANLPKRLAVDFVVTENDVPLRTTDKGLKVMKLFKKIKSRGLFALDVFVLMVMSILTDAFKPP